MLPLFAQSETTSAGAPGSLKVPMNTRSNATFGEDVMPLKSGCARSCVSHCTLPSEAFRRMTVPFDVPTRTEWSNTAGEEKPLVDDSVQIVSPVFASRAKRPCIVVTNTFPYATAGVVAISRAPVSRSHIGRQETGAPAVDTTLLFSSTR